METTIINAIEYRDLPLDWLHVSPTNPRKSFDEEAMHQLAASIDANGVLQPLLVRPRGERHFEIVFGERRYRGAKLTARATVPVCIRQMTDAEVLEAQLVENLQRAEVHPMEEAQGFKALLDLEEPKYTVELIAAKVGKTPAYIAQRLKLIDLTPPVIEAFYSNDIGVGHALLLAKLPAEQQEAALSACFKEDWSAPSNRKAKRILLPVRSLQFWIEQNVLLLLKDAPFDKRDAHLVETAGTCADCPKRTGHNKLLFCDLGKQDACTDPSCYRAKVDAHVAKQIAAKPELVQISTAYGKAQEGSKVLPRNHYTTIREEKPKSKEEATRPEYKVCKYTTEAIIAEGSDVGTVQKVCANPTCPIHHPKAHNTRNDERQKAEQEKQRIESCTRQYHWPSCSCRHRRSRPGAPDETRSALCRRASDEPVGRKPRRHPRQAARHQESQRHGFDGETILPPFFAVPTKAPWDASWSNPSSFCLPHAPIQRQC